MSSPVEVCPIAQPGSRQDRMRAAGRLVDRALRGDPSAKLELVTRLLPVLRARVQRARRRSPELQRFEVHDLVHDIWVVLLAEDAQQLRRWDPKRGATLEGYIGMIAERELGNHVDKARTKKRAANVIALDEAAEVPGSRAQPEASAIARDTALRLRDHLEQELPARGQAIFLYLFSDGRSPDEVARTLGVQKQVVYNWQHKIRKLARRFIGEN